MPPLTLIDGALRVDGGTLVLTKASGEACCCGCRPDQLSDTTINLSATHGCNCAKFKFYVNDRFIKNLNFNNAYGPPTVVETANADLGTGAETNGTCCLVSLKLVCDSSPGDDAFGFGSTCGEAFGTSVCHTNITSAEIVLPNGKVVVVGILPDGVNTPVEICPDDLTPPAQFRMGLQAEEVPAAANGVCLCCGLDRAHREHVKHNPAAGLGTTLWRLVQKFLFRNSHFELDSDLRRYIDAADLVPPASWSRHADTLFIILQQHARKKDLPFDDRAARIIIRRALSLVNAVANNG